MHSASIGLRWQSGSPHTLPTYTPPPSPPLLPPPPPPTPPPPLSSKLALSTWSLNTKRPTMVSALTLNIHTITDYQQLGLPWHQHFPCIMFISCIHDPSVAMHQDFLLTAFFKCMRQEPGYELGTSLIHIKVVCKDLRPAQPKINEFNIWSCC